MLIELFEELKESVSKKAKKDDFFDAEQMDQVTTKSHQTITWIIGVRKWS
jgi:hypothetical protein